MADDSKTLSVTQCVLIEDALVAHIKQAISEGEYAETVGAHSAHKFWADRATELGEILALVGGHMTVTVSGETTRRRLYDAR